MAIVTMMKNGKFILLTATAVILLAAKKLKANKNEVEVSAPSFLQYKNRLNEFRINDLENANTEYKEFIEMGLNPRDAFELTVARAIFL